MLQFDTHNLRPNSVIEFCILPELSLNTILNNLHTNMDVIYIDSRGSLTALSKKNTMRESPNIDDFSQKSLTENFNREETNFKATKKMKPNDSSKKYKIQLNTESTIFRIFDLKEFLKTAKKLKKFKYKLLIFDSLPYLIDTLNDKQNVHLVYNQIWQLIYENSHTFLIINHYRIIIDQKMIKNMCYMPRLGVLWLSNVTYRILIKSKHQDLAYEIAQTPEKSLIV